MATRSKSNGVLPAVVVLLIALVIIGFFIALESLPTVTITYAVAPAPAAKMSAQAKAPSAPQGAALPAPAPTSIGPAPVQVSSGTSNVQEVFRLSSALAYPVLVPPDASRQPVFPDVPYGGRPALAKYESPFEDGDFCDNTPCGMDVSQFYYRVMTAGEVTIPDLGVSCVATETKGCAVIVINHFGPTAMYRGNTIDHGFTVAGRVFDMSKPELVTQTAQALLDHYMLRMTDSPDGANCSTIEACPSVEWHVVVIGNAAPQVHWTGIFYR